VYGCPLPWQPVFGQAAFSEPNWDRALAVESTKSIDTDSVGVPLFNIKAAAEGVWTLEIEPVNGGTDYGGLSCED
jgi:hypothetical protein